MKKISLVALFILLVCTMSLRAETEQDLATLFPYLHSLCITEAHVCLDSNDPNLQTTYQYNYQVKDTITIHDKLYVKMAEDCFLREEGKKIWIYDGLSKDLLLYDFGLEVGDSLPCLYRDDVGLCTCGNILSEYLPEYLVVTAIKERILDNEKTYKEWVFDYGYSQVEGIGCMHGFLKKRILEPIPTGGDYEWHMGVCASVDGEQLYKIAQEEMQMYKVSCKCGYDASSDIASVMTDTRICVIGRVLHIGKAMGTKFTLTDITGKQVMKFMADSDEMQVDVSGLHSGIYILTGKDISQKIAIF